MISIVNYIPSVPGFDSAWGGEIPIFAWRESRPVSDQENRGRSPRTGG